MCQKETSILIVEMNNSTDITDASGLIWTIVSPFLIVLGTVGNGLCIFVLTRQTTRKSMVSSYLTCLAVADLMTLYTGLLPNWIIRTFNTDLHIHDPFICKVGHWIVYFSLDLSAWVLVSFTVERAISVWKPLHVRDIITRRVFIINMATIVIITMAVNSHFVWGYDVSSIDPFVCDSKSEDHKHFVSKIFPWIDLFLFSLGPFICHIIGNTVIVVGLKQNERLICRYRSNATILTLRRNCEIALTLLCVNTVYLICTLPISVHLILDNLNQLEDTEEEVMFACFSLLMYLNNSVNFITYMLRSERFRETVRKVLRGRPLQTPASTSLTTLSTSRSTLASSVSLGSTVSVSAI